MFLSLGVLVIYHKELQCRKHWALSQAHMKPDALRTDVSGKSDTAKQFKRYFVFNNSFWKVLILLGMIITYEVGFGIKMYMKYFKYNTLCYRIITDSLIPHVNVAAEDDFNYFYIILPILIRPFRFRF